MPSPDVHPDAAKRANELAVHAMDAMSTQPGARAGRDSSYAPNIPIAGHLRPEDVAGPVLMEETDRFGREIGRSYANLQYYFELRGAAHEEYRKAVRTLHQQRGIRFIASEKTVAKLVFEWMWRTRIDGPTSAMSAFVLEQVQSQIADFEIVVPLFGVHVQAPLQIGLVTVADLTAAELNEWRALSHKSAPGHKEAADQIHDKLQNELQGRAAARMKVRAEQEFAVQRATEQVELSLAVLRLASVGAFAPERPTTVALMGHEAVAHGRHIVLGPNERFQPSEFVVHPDEQRPWVLDIEMIGKTVLPIIRPWSDLLAREKRTSFEETALKSMLLYSRATRYRNISEKLLHVFAAVESLLLRNESEPISATVGDRLAFAVGTSPEARLQVARSFREVYALRSQFVHHALETAPDSDTMGVLERFLVTICQFFMNVGGALKTFESKDAFIEALERRKYA